MQERRFYEKDLLVKTAVNGLLATPTIAQPLLGQAINDMAERDHNANQLLKNLKSLGPDITLSLYKASRKQRTIDQPPSVHRVVSYLLVMESPARTELCGRMIELLTLLHAPLSWIRLYTKPEQMEALAGIVACFTLEGAEKARHMLDGLSHIFNLSPTPEMPPKKAKTTPYLGGREDLQNAREGLLIRGDFLEQ